MYTHTHLYTHTCTDILLLKKETFHLVDTLILADQNNWEIFQEKKIYETFH